MGQQTSGGEHKEGKSETEIYEAKIIPALGRQIALMSDLKAHAVHDAGVWRLPDGPAYYAASVMSATTTSLSPETIHQTGLEIVAEHSARINAILKAEGMTAGTVGERLHALYEDVRYRYQNTDKGIGKLIGDLNLKVSAVQSKLPGYFKTLPKAPVEIRRTGLH